MIKDDDSEGTDTRIAEAHEAFARRDYAVALNGYKQLCDVRPNDAFFADRHAFCHVALKQWLQAVELWSLIIKRFGINASRLNYVAQCLIETRDYVGAEAVLATHQDEIKVNANYFAYRTVTALAVGEINDALRSAKQLQELAIEEKWTTANDHLAWLLARMARHGYGENVLRLVDLLLPSIADKSKLLRTCVEVAAPLRRHEATLDYASRMIALDPNLLDGYIIKMRALLEAGLLGACRDFLQETHEKFKLVRSRKEADKLADIALQLSSRTAWTELLLPDSRGTTFQSANRRAAALLTLKQYDDAIELCRAAIKDNFHPRFLTVLGKCYEGLCQFDAALFWFTQAVQVEPTSDNCIIHLYKIQMKMGLKAPADLSIRTLLRRRTNMPILAAITETLEHTQIYDPQVYERYSEREETPTLSNNTTWLHGGDFGDVIYAMAAIKGGGGGQLFLSCFEGTTQPMTDAKIEFIRPLLASQPYITDVKEWNGEHVDKDFTVFRHAMFPTIDLATQHWLSVQENPRPDVKKQWLSLPERKMHGRPVFARSRRYRNDNWEAFWQELKAASPDAIFVGTDAEFDDFGHGEHRVVDNALDLAQIIDGASVFVGNQSLPYAIAEGLKVGRVLEISPHVPNCIFPGALALGFNRALQT